MSTQRIADDAVTGPPGQRVCARCSVSKPDAGFRKGRSTCLACHSERKRARRRELTQRPNIVSPGHKTCTKCKREQPSSAFTPNRGLPDGLCGWCKPCGAAGQKAQRARNAARSHIVSPSEKKCTSCKLILPAAAFSKNHCHKSGLSGACRKCDVTRLGAYVRTNGKAKERARSKRYEQTTGGRFRRNLSVRRRRSLMREAPSPGVTAKQWQAIVEYFGGCCGYCLEPADSIDHLTPIAAGGLDAPENVVPACGTCNSSKHDLSLLSLLLQPTRLVTTRMFAAGTVGSLPFGRSRDRLAPCGFGISATPQLDVFLGP